MRNILNPNSRHIFTKNIVYNSILAFQLYKYCILAGVITSNLNKNVQVFKNDTSVFVTLHHQDTLYKHTMASNANKANDIM